VCVLCLKEDAKQEMLHNSYHERQREADLLYENILVGDEFFFEKIITQYDVEAFASLTGDYNSLHMSHTYAQQTVFGQRVVHGLLGASLFSQIYGMKCPGRRALLITQEVNFIQPLLIDSKIKVIGTIARKIDALKILLFDLKILDEKATLMIEGHAKVKVLDG